MELSAAEITSALEEIDTVLGFLEANGKDLLEGDNFSQTDENINFEILTLENVAKVKGKLLAGGEPSCLALSV